MAINVATMAFTGHSVIVVDASQSSDGRRSHSFEPGYASAWSHLHVRREFAAPVPNLETKPMGVNVFLCNGDGIRISAVGDESPVLTGALLEKLAVLASPMLRFVAPYDLTMFNAAQAAALAVELEGLISIVNDLDDQLALEQTTLLARRCASEQYTYLWFFGD